MIRPFATLAAFLVALQTLIATAYAQNAPVIVTLTNADSGITLGSTLDQQFSAAQPGAAESRWVLQRLGDGQLRLYAEQTGAFLHAQNGPVEIGAIQADWLGAIWLFDTLDQEQRLVQIVNVADPSFGLVLSDQGRLVVTQIAGPLPGSVWQIGLADAPASQPDGPPAVSQLPPDTQFSKPASEPIPLRIYNAWDQPLEVIRITETGGQEAMGIAAPSAEFEGSAAAGEVYQLRHQGQTLRQIVVSDTFMTGAGPRKKEFHFARISPPPLDEFDQYAQIKVLNRNDMAMRVRAGGIAGQPDIGGVYVDELGPLSWSIAFARPGVELWFTDPAGNPIGGIYQVTREPTQRVEAPLPAASDKLAFVINTTGQPLDVVEVSDDGESQTYLGTAPEGGVILRPVIEDQLLKFSDGSEWIGGDYLATADAFQFVRPPLPVQTAQPSGPPPSQYPSGSIAVFVANTTEAPVSVVEYISEDDQLLRGEIEALNGGTVMGDPGMKLAFIQTIDGAPRFIGNFYDVTGDPQQIAKFPLPLPQTDLIVQVNVSNTTEIPVSVLDHKSADDQDVLTNIPGFTAGSVSVPADSLLSFAQTIDGELKFVGGRYSVGTNRFQAMEFPVPQNAQVVAEAIGSVDLQIINISDAPVFPVEMITDSQQRQLGEVPASNNATIGVEPGMLLRFVQTAADGSDGLDFIGGAYRVQDGTSQQIMFPVAEPDLPVAPTICWRDSYGRGAGWAGQECPPGEENFLGLCYPKCRAGYDGVFDGCIRSECPGGWTDAGLTCVKPAPYSRGAEPLRVVEGLRVAPAMERCEARFGVGNCEGANFIAEDSPTIVYEKCPAGYEQAPLITNLCTPSCSEAATGVPGMTDIGAFCTKDTYGRRGAQFPSCGTTAIVDGEEVAVEKDNTGLLCYPQCRKPGMVGVGPVCWDSCPTQLPYNCGAFCAKDVDTCALGVTAMVTEPSMAVANGVLIGVTAGAAAGATTGINAGRAAATTAAKTAGSAAAKSAARVAARAALRAKVKAALGATAKDMVVDSAVNAAFMGGASAGGADFDPVDLDPLGIAQTVRAFAHPICSDITWSEYQP